MRITRKCARGFEMRAEQDRDEWVSAQGVLEAEERPVVSTGGFAAMKIV